MNADPRAGGSAPADSRARSFAGWLVRVWPTGEPDKVEATAAFSNRSDANQYVYGIDLALDYSITPQIITVREP